MLERVLILPVLATLAAMFAFPVSTEERRDGHGERDWRLEKSDDIWRSKHDDADDDRIKKQYATTLAQSVLEVVDTDPRPNVFRAELVVDKQDALVEGTLVHALIYKDVNNTGAYPAVAPNGLPIPQIVVNLGDEVIVKLTNNLAEDCPAVACDSSIHWHGLELDNDSDGTGVTQNRLEAGDSHTYRFFAPRPGVFWFHPHMKPGGQVFAGVYGTFIVKDPNEAKLQKTRRIPAQGNTHTLVLSDTEFDENGNIGLLDTSTPPAAVPWATLKN